MVRVLLLFSVSGKCKVFYGQEPPSGESTTTECGFNYQLRTYSNLLKQLNEELLVEVDHNQGV